MGANELTELIPFPIWLIICIILKNVKGYCHVKCVIMYIINLAAESIKMTCV